ncbi:MAG: hypothetical protein Q3M24_06585 [Candidatus Electrothrix aestuarii]|uniref:Cytochrome c domain-containing protein n=1 Tax=Candidatus Electrothrix aestuarii TaxID=3062594 RepID=A0AAU8LZS4_9BACT|nr:hypothetical protein [Candidatus Electrothrix aestuarii]
MRITKALVLLSSLSLLLSLSACKEPSNEQAEAPEPAVSVTVPEAPEATETAPQDATPVEEVLVDDSGAGEKTVDVTGEGFGCVRDMEAIRGMYVGNLLGNIDATIAVANSEEGGVYPPGTIIQIVPTEAMVKREAGFNEATNDWEFFILDVSAEGTKIAARGGEELENPFGQNCLSCHAQAEPKWDMVCESGHGCQPIPITRPMIVALQKTDKRCAPVELTDEDKKALADLQALIEGFKAKMAAAAAAAAEAGESDAVAPEAETDEEVAAPPADEAPEDAVPAEEEGEEKAE